MKYAVLFFFLFILTVPAAAQQPTMNCLVFDELGQPLSLPCPVSGSFILYEPYEGHMVYQERYRAMLDATPVYHIPVTPQPTLRVLALVDLRVRESCSYSSPARYVAAFGSELLFVDLQDDGGEWLPSSLVNPVNEWAVVQDKDGVQGCVLTRYRRANESADRNLVAFVTR